MYIYMYMYLCIFIYVCTRGVCVRVRVVVYISMYVCTHGCIYIYIYACIYVYVCIPAGIWARAICAHQSCVLKYALLAPCEHVLVKPAR